MLDRGGIEASLFSISVCIFVCLCVLTGGRGLYMKNYYCLPLQRIDMPSVIEVSNTEITVAGGRTYFSHQFRGEGSQTSVIYSYRRAYSTGVTLPQSCFFFFFHFYFWRDNS